MIVKLRNKKYYAVEHNNSSKMITCTCGGQVLIEGEAIYKSPVGFGFHPDCRW